MSVHGSRLVLCVVSEGYLHGNGVIGKHGVGNVNSNDLRLLNLCSEFDLIITNTLLYFSKEINARPRGCTQI